MQNNQKGFGTTEGLLIAGIVCLLITIGLFVWHRGHKKSTQTINSFETCVSAGNSVQETYPEQCSANGKSYVNPKQSAPVTPVATKQGVQGKITIRSGNCMPPIPESKVEACDGMLYTTPSKVIIKQSVDQKNKENKAVVKTIDNVKGYFDTELQPGVYNMYVVYNGNEYCNSFGSQPGEDCEFTVTKDRVTSYTLLINNAVD